jgi:hypothetical protein
LGTGRVTLSPAFPAVERTAKQHGASVNLRCFIG